jgi:hypothetical protein
MNRVKFLQVNETAEDNLYTNQELWKCHCLRKLDIKCSFIGNVRVDEVLMLKLFSFYPVAASLCLGKDAKKRKKRKDVNNKGQALQKGSDMDAFIDEVCFGVNVTSAEYFICACLGLFIIRTSLKTDCSTVCLAV